MLSKVGEEMRKGEKDLRRELEELEMRMTLQSRNADLNRARTISVGSAGGGTVEISMRCMNGDAIWYIMQPVEVIEYINQMAAIVGCHIHVKPREDFASWRRWKTPDDELKRLNGHPPFASDIDSEIMKIGADIPEPEMQAGLNFSIENEEQVEVKQQLEQQQNLQIDSNIRSD